MGITSITGSPLDSATSNLTTVDATGNYIDNAGGPYNDFYAPILAYGQPASPTVPATSSLQQYGGLLLVGGFAFLLLVAMKR